VTFHEVLLACANNREFVHNFDRLRGTHLAQVGSGSIVDRIDDATGYRDEELHLFIEAVHDLVWSRMPR